MQASFAAGKVFTMSKVSGVERNNPQYICVSVPNVIKYDRVGKQNATVFFTPQLDGASVAAQLPKTIEPQESLAELLRIPDKRLVNFMALVASSERPANMTQEMVKVTLADPTGRIQVKFWGNEWRGVFEEKEGQLVCGFNFWASMADHSDGPALRALSSVQISHLLWPAEKDLRAGGRGLPLLTNQEETLQTVQECLTEGGSAYDMGNATYESAEATATAVALLELTNKHLGA